LSQPSISVVIPALDEETYVRPAIESVREAFEVIVVDGGSRDRTREVAVQEGARVLESGPGRGVQLACGAGKATGEWLVFLHADTRLEPGWADALRGLPEPIVGGAFRFAVDSPRPAYRLIEKGVAWRCRLFRLPFGDQGIFVRRAVYAETGGFRPFPLMEDVEFMRRLRSAGPLAFPTVRALTSPRHWERHGLLRSTLRNWWIVGLYAAGWPPQRLARLYGHRT